MLTIRRLELHQDEIFKRLGMRGQSTSSVMHAQSQICAKPMSPQTLLTRGALMAFMEYEEMASGAKSFTRCWKVTRADRNLDFRPILMMELQKNRTNRGIIRIEADCDHRHDATCLRFHREKKPRVS